MRSRAVILVIVAVLAAVAIVVGVVAVAGADSSTTLPSLTAPELLAKMSQSHGQTQSISGDISWTNGLFGNLANAAHDTFGAMPAQSPLLASGAGRIWLSKDGMRVESQGGAGDQVAVVSEAGHDAWLYDYAANTARHIVVTGAPEGSQTPLPTTSATALTPSAISAMLLRLAPLGAMSVDGQTTVAGRDAYVLKFTPAAADTALGSVQVAIDGKTYVPLRLQVFAKGATEPTLQFGFDTVSFGAVDPSRFSFTPPAGAAVTTKTIDAGKVREQAKAEGDKLKAAAQEAVASGDLGRAFLTQAQAAKLVPYELATASSEARPFRSAFVLKQGIPVTALGSPLLDLSGLGADAQGAGQAAAATAGPTAAQVYGSGLGSIVLFQAPATAQTEKQLKQLPEVFDKMDINGHQAAVVTTPLGGVVVWQQGDTTLAAAGIVPAADLKAFASSVR